jgi:ATP-binding cassette subfamily B protein
MSKKKKLSLKQYFNIAKWSLGIGLRYSKKHFILAFFTESILTLKSLTYSFLYARIIDDAINLASSSDVSLKDILGKLVFIFIADILFAWIRNVNRLSNRKLRYISRVYQQEYEFTKVFNLGLQTLQLPEVNKLREQASRWLNLVDELNRNLLIIFSSFLLFIVSAVYIIKIIPIIFPIFLIYAIILIYEKSYFFKKDFEWQVSDYNTDQKAKNYRIAYNLLDTSYIDEISVIGAFGYLSNKVKTFFANYNEGLFDIVTKERKFSFLLDLSDTLIIFGGYIKTFQLLIKGDISVGTTTFYMSTIESFDSAIGNVVSSFVVAGDFITKLSKVYEFYHLEPVVSEGDIVLPRLDIPPSIEFKNVSFSYPKSKMKIFDNFNLKIESGEKVAIVGINGAGKSTMTKLIARLYDPQEGSILINGNDLKDLKIDDWYKNMGLLFQDFKIYESLTVEENIYIGKTAKPINKDKLMEASKNADAHEFITKYPKKYKTFMNERFDGGIQASKGQKQKVAIARFFYRDAPLAIFDEPTSAIDAESEYKIFNRIYDFFDNKTVIIISHRFSTVRNADRIIVLDNGNIVEEGSHKELMAMNGKYANAFKIQADGYKE